MSDAVAVKVKMEYVLKNSVLHSKNIEDRGRRRDIREQTDLEPVCTSTTTVDRTQEFHNI